MSQTDWAKTYAAMDKRIILKYEQLPRGEQIGKAPSPANQDEKNRGGVDVRFLSNSDRIADHDYARGQSFLR